ncbi:L domain-like protein [Anaeromyces robustus]|uniref:L domain-like protein n=1 Tax=Anaeromyces robustus TaxID=1754192 RepID=A0A1Y1XGL1_9FUNG|nr:L domain-like protein [Anaeromyces robustus]|eukprot:ORX84863.1 L domain-like protein [Anaeromyces robustus]
MEGKSENNNKITECTSRDGKCMMITRWELGSTFYFSSGLKFLYIEYDNTLSKFNEEISKSQLTDELREVFKKTLQTLPNSIEKLSDLRMLKVYSGYNKEKYNYINLKVLPTFIENLNNLRVLDLYHNELLTLPDSIGNLKFLEDLNLSYNNLSTLPDSIGNLKNLEDLNLSSNNLSTLPDSIGNLKNLEKLNLSHNHSFSELPDSIGKLKNLKILNLYSTNLKSLPESLENLINLEDILLKKYTYYCDSQYYPKEWYYSIIVKTFNHCSCTPPDSNYNTENNLSLNLSGKNLKQIPFGIYMMNTLNVLDISGNQIIKIPPLLKKLTNLKKLYIQNNPNLNYFPDFLWEMKYLEELKIDGRLIKDLPLNANFNLNEIIENKIIIDLTLAGKNKNKLNDQELLNLTGPYTVYLNKK